MRRTLENPRRQPARPAQPDAVIVDNIRLAKLYPGEEWNELPKLGKPFYQRFVRRQFEMNDHRAMIVGVCEATPTFQSNPVMYTTYARAKKFVPQERKILSYVLAKTEPGVSPEVVAAGSTPRPAWGPSAARNSSGSRSSII